jgi:guanosine-3',5'-bis(diphosphate) 3'-pyrophosphohydrolase
MNKFLKALRTASIAHKFQLRKDGITPFINHPIQVAELISSVGGIQDEVILSAAILHDIIEDTATTYDEVKNTFGFVIADIVMECSDNKDLPKAERKRLQVVDVSSKSYEAKIVKLADKIANMTDIIVNPAIGWDKERKLAYFEWSREVVDAGLRGVNSGLEAMFNDVYFQREWIK